MHVAFGQHHGRVKADDGEHARDMQDGLHDLLAHIGLRIVELRGVVPGKGRTVVAMVDITCLARAVIADAKRDGCVGLVVVVIVDLDLGARVGTEVGTVEAIRRIRALPAHHEPVRMLDDPGRIDAHVVGHHIARQPQAIASGPVAKILICRIAAEVLGDVVLLQRVRGGHRIALPAQMLDALRGHRTLPQPDQPERGHAAIREQAQLLVRDHVQLVDVPPVLAAQLFQPHIGALGDHDDVGHPRLIGGEGLVLVQGRLIITRIAQPRRVPRPEPPHPVRPGLIRILKADVLIPTEALAAEPRGTMPVDVRPGWVEAHPDRDVLFPYGVDGQQNRLQVGIHEAIPVLPNVVQLRGERVGA